MSVSLEQAIRIAYEKFICAVDSILTTGGLRSQFVAQVLQLCPNETEDSVLQGLVRMRKRGEEKGGLPRRFKSRSKAKT